MAQQIYLKWNNHPSIVNDFQNFLSTETMVDVTLVCEGKSLKAHKLVLSACSPLFQTLLLENPCRHPIIILHDVRFSELRAVIEFMYHGEVNVTESTLAALIKCAETLRVKVLGEVMIAADESESQSGNASASQSGDECDIQSSAVSASQLGDESEYTLSHQPILAETPSPPKLEINKTQNRSMNSKDNVAVSDMGYELSEAGKQKLSSTVEPSGFNTTLHSQSNSDNSFCRTQEFLPIEESCVEVIAETEELEDMPISVVDQMLTDDTEKFEDMPISLVGQMLTDNVSINF